MHRTFVRTPRASLVALAALSLALPTLAAAQSSAAQTAPAQSVAEATVVPAAIDAAPVAASVTPPADAAPRSLMFGDAAVGARHASASATNDRAPEAVAETHVGAGKNAALMIVGVAGIITGAVVG